MFEDAVHEFDLDISLRDAGCDGDLSPERRAIANLCVGTGSDDAYYSMRELREAMLLVFERDARGRGKLCEILQNECDDLQRAVYYALAGRGIVRALEALDWLIVLLQGRALTSSRLKLGGVYVLPLVSPYVAEEPDGPVAGADPGFRLGRSWSVESPTGR